MQIGIMRVPVPYRSVPMPMHMRFAHRPFMLVIVMHIMRMSMLVFQRFVHMFVLVTFGQMKP